MEDRLNALEVALKVGLIDLGNKIENSQNSTKAATASGNRGSFIAWVALLLSALGLFVAMDNRTLILTVSSQTAKNTRDLENIMPVIFQDYTPPNASTAK